MLDHADIIEEALEHHRRLGWSVPLSLSDDVFHRSYNRTAGRMDWRHASAVTRIARRCQPLHGEV